MNSEEQKRFLAMALRRTAPGSGSQLDEVRDRGVHYTGQPDLGPLADVRHVVVGGLAVALYMPPRNTLDVDVLIARDDLAYAEERLAESGWRYLGPLSVGGSSWSLPNGIPLDLLALERTWIREALDQPVRDAGPAATPFIALPYLVIMKLESGRLQDLADISRMLGYAGVGQIDEVRAAVRQHRPQDVEDLESMLQLGKMEHQ
ncbi:MAG: hypothetical protein ACOCWJ_06260 [Verrucomicrobiota bacterium]